MFDDNNAHNSDSATTLIEHAEPTEGSIHETSAPEPTVHSTDAQDDKQPATEDFASALESFTTESEEAVSDDNVLKGTVLKLTRHPCGGRYRRQVRGHAAAIGSAGS